MASEVVSLLPKGAQIRLSARGDLDADGDGDALLVLEDGCAGSADVPRTLRLLLRDADGRLQVAVDGPRAIPCRRCCGMAGDPLQGIRIESGGFVLRVEGGSRALWSSEFRFAYTDGAAAWKLQSAVHAGFDRANGEQAEYALAPEDIGDVALADFVASALLAGASP